VKQYYERYWEHTELSPDTDPYATTRLRILRKAVPRGPLRVLDVGAGEGHLVAALAAEGVSASGMDISETAVRAAAERYPGRRFKVHSAEDLPWPVEPGSLDLVVAFEVIEHLVEPRRLLAGARAALRPGGYVALTTPYHGRLKNVAIALLAFDRHFDVDGYHLRFFSDSALRRLLDDEGFTVERCVHYGRVPGIRAGVFVWAARR
jgi:2-polyprenyl-3-methyl-5-hydroxy-6-metoxy-1,4-benzoquinol methylase